MVSDEAPREVTIITHLHTPLSGLGSHLSVPLTQDWGPTLEPSPCDGNCNYKHRWLRDPPSVHLPFLTLNRTLQAATAAPDLGWHSRHQARVAPISFSQGSTARSELRPRWLHLQGPAATRGWRPPSQSVHALSPTLPDSSGTRCYPRPRGKRGSGARPRSTHMRVTCPRGLPSTRHCGQGRGPAHTRAAPFFGNEFHLFS